MKSEEIETKREKRKVLLHQGNDAVSDGICEMVVEIENHDSHYREEEKSGVEPILVMEMISRKKNIPEDVKLNMCLSAKHLLRAGDKDDWRKELQKCQNYINRALTGGWL